MKIRHMAIMLAGLTVVAHAAYAQDPVHWTAPTHAHSTAPGGKTSVTLTATIDEGWHIYSVTQGPGGPFPTHFAVAAKQPFHLGGTITATKPKVTFDQTFGINIETYEKNAEFTVPITVDTIATIGKQTLQLSARYEACNASTCLPPTTVQFKISVTVKKKHQGRG